jgi:hypothetical protein
LKRVVDDQDALQLEWRAIGHQFGAPDFHEEQVDDAKEHGRERRLGQEPSVRPPVCFKINSELSK